jgi:nitroreductase
METLEAIRQRRSVRRFRTGPVGHQLLEKLVDCGRLAPTARAEQPWEFVVVTNRDVRTAIGRTTDHGKFIAEAPACIAVFCKDTKYYLEDGCAATENILLAAADLGLGACWVAGDKKAYADQVRQMLGVPEGHKLVSLLAVGYPSDDQPAKGKRPLEDVLHWDRF